jgi:hypothetical protein
MKISSNLPSQSLLSAKLATEMLDKRSCYRTSAAISGRVVEVAYQLHSSSWMENPVRQKRNKEKDQNEYK